MEKAWQLLTKKIKKEKIIIIIIIIILTFVIFFAFSLPGSYLPVVCWSYYFYIYIIYIFFRKIVLCAW